MSCKKEFNQDTIELLLQVNSGCKMAIGSMEQVATAVDDKLILDIIKKYNYLNKMIFISFEIDNLKVLRKLNKDINIQYLSGIEDNKKKEEVIKYCKELKLDADVYFDNITKEFIDNCHKNNIKVNVWTVDSKEDAERLINMGVDYITSNILE